MPQISGNNVVWSYSYGTDSEIFLYNGISTIQLTNNSYDEYDLQISGNNVIWSGGSEIFFYNGTSTIQLTNNSYNDLYPAISGNNVVWQGWDGTDYEIFFYNGTSTIQLTNNSDNDGYPAISGNNVVWNGSDGTGTDIDGSDKWEIYQTNLDPKILPTITLAVSPSSVTEDGTANLIYTFTRTGVTTSALTVYHGIAGTANGSDYTGATPGTGIITFAASASTATLTIDPTVDTTVESDETVAVTLTTGTGYTVGTTTAVTGTITNDDVVASPTITLAVSPSSVTEDGTANLIYTFTRTGVTTSALTVNYGITGTADGSDYTGATPGTGKTITFAAGASTATVTIDPTVDTTVEIDKTVAVTLTTGTGYTVGTTTAVTGTITNDDGNFQQITSLANLKVAPGKSLSVPLFYNTSTNDNTLGGIGLRLHYDSSDIVFKDTTNLLSTNLFGNVTDNSDTENFDADTNTNRYIQFQYLDFAGNWPNQTLPLKLGDFNFTAQSTFANTQLNITSSSLAAGYGLKFDPLLVSKQTWNLDIDGNGKVDALTDGIMAVRYMFGSAFSGNALIAGAIAPNATRSLSEIQTYLQEGTTQKYLDIDGNGKVDALTDGIMAVRYMFGSAFSGNVLIAGAIAPDAIRDLSGIQSYLSGLNTLS